MVTTPAPQPGAHGMLDAVHASLDPEQLAAVTAPPGPVCIIAGAGTGKTTALTGRIAHHVLTGAWDPQAVLAVTHSTRAAGNMRDRLTRIAGAALGDVTAKTFHATAHAICRENWQLTGRSHGFAVTDQAYQHTRQALRNRGRRDPDSALVQDVAAEIGWAKSSLVTPDHYGAAATRAGRAVSGMTAKEVAATYLAYDQHLRDIEAVDFSDLLILAARALTHPDAPAELVNRYQHVLVDEFQDTDPAQSALLDAITAGRTDITVVGDPRQAIYSFKGSDSSILASFPQRYTGTTVVTLVRDYRSTPQVVTAANTLMRTPAPEALIGCRPAGPTPVVVDSPNESTEVQTVVRRIAAQIADGVHPSQIAVLYRFNSQSAPFEEALTKAGIAYEVLDKAKFFDRPEVLAVLRAAWSKMSALEESHGASMPPGVDILAAAAADTGFDATRMPDGAGAARDRWEAIKALLDLAASRPDSDRLSARALLAELAHRRQESHHVSAASVTLTTLHKAKGLEWQSVFLVRMTEGSLPSAYATTDALIAEEQRLAYVGITRAAKLLTCTRSAARTSGSRTWPIQPSRFLLAAGLVDAAPAPARSAQRPARPAASATTGTPLTAEQRAVLERLLAWRRKAAKARSMPDFTIVSEDVLTSIATSGATDRRELLRVRGLGLAKVNAYGAEILAVLTPPA